MAWILRLQEQQVSLDDVAELSQLDTSTTVNNQVKTIKADDKPEADIKKADDSEKEETVSIHLSQVDSLKMSHNNTTSVKKQEVRNISDS